MGLFGQFLLSREELPYQTLTHFCFFLKDYYPPKKSLFGRCLAKKNDGHCVEIEEVAKETMLERCKNNKKKLQL